MTHTLATWLLRLYPRTWRMRYEEEVRALLEERPPGITDLFGMLLGAIGERLAALIDPIAHPVLSRAITGLFGWFGAVAAIAVVAAAGAAMLRNLIGVAPAWAAPVAEAVYLITLARAFVSHSMWAEIPMSITLQPMSRATSRRWWVVLMAGAVLVSWAMPDIQLLRGMGGLLWWAAPLFLLSATEVAWRERRAARHFAQVRAEYLAAMTELARISRLNRQGERAPADATAAHAAFQRALADMDAARTAYRAARLWISPAHRPLGIE